MDGDDETERDGDVAKRRRTHNRGRIGAGEKKVRADRKKNARKKNLTKKEESTINCSSELSD